MQNSEKLGNKIKEFIAEHLQWAGVEDEFRLVIPENKHQTVFDFAHQVDEICQNNQNLDKRIKNIHEELKRISPEKKDNPGSVGYALLRGLTKNQ